MRKKSIKTLSLLLALPFIIMGCNATSPNMSSVPTTAVYDSSYGTPSSVATSVPSEVGFMAGDLPTYISDEEKKILAIYDRKVNIQFPLRVGIFSASNTSNLDETVKKDLFGKFINKLKANENISQVVEIPKSLSATVYDIESIRKLAARFQVSVVLVVTEKYEATNEDKKALTTPIDVVTGIRTWKSVATVETYAIDVLTGIIISSSISEASSSEKYNKNDPDNKNKDTQLTEKTATESWNNIYTKIDTEIKSYKKILNDAKANPVPTAIPTVVQTPVATATPTAVVSPTPSASATTTP